MEKADRLKFAWLAMLVASACVVAVYWTGLHGPFLLDDETNLHAIPEWLSGHLGLNTLLLERGAGTFGRPVSMATFALNAWIGGFAPFPLKIGNLITHLLCGLAIFLFLRLLLKRDRNLQGKAALYAAIVAAIWLLHPLHASTVLYVVQRMAQLAALFTLLGLALYVASRQRLEQGASFYASVGLLLGVPIMTILAFLSKENGILLPLLCAVVELAYFSNGKRLNTVRTFHGLYVFAPLVAGLVLFFLVPGRVLDGYVARDFTLTQRLLSQPRALCDYLWKLIVPNPPKMGVYTDDFVVSTGLLAPITTLVCIVVLIGISYAAVRWRKTLPGVFFGWFFFLVAHALEGGPLPLELYFEHRNYLPSVGILAALVALAVAAGQSLARAQLPPQRIGVVLTAGVLAVLAFGTHGRAKVWRSDELIAASSLHAHPHSLRANVAVLTSSIREGNREGADAAIKRLIESPTPRHRSLAHSYRLFVECKFDRLGRIGDLDTFVTQSPMPLTLAEAQPFNLIYFAAEANGCGEINDSMIGTALAKLADRASAYEDGNVSKLRVRYQSASFLVRAQEWPAALKQAKLAWQPTAEPPVALPLVLAQIHTGDIDGARKTLDQVKQRADPTNVQEQQAISWIQNEIDYAHRIMPTQP